MRNHVKAIILIIITIISYVVTLNYCNISLFFNSSELQPIKTPQDVNLEPKLGPDLLTRFSVFFILNVFMGLTQTALIFVEQQQYFLILSIISFLNAYILFTTILPSYLDAQDIIETNHLETSDNISFMSSSSYIILICVVIFIWWYFAYKHKYKYDRIL